MNNTRWIVLRQIMRGELCAVNCARWFVCDELCAVNCARWIVHGELCAVNCAAVNCAWWIVPRRIVHGEFCALNCTRWIAGKPYWITQPDKKDIFSFWDSSYFRQLDSTIFDRFCAVDYYSLFGFFPLCLDFEIIGLSYRSKWSLLQYIRAQILKAKFSKGFT
jgi:hypothetical protein